MFKCFWGHKYRLLSRCNIYYDHKNRRVSEDSLFCEICMKLDKRDKQSNTLIIYDKI